MPATIPSLSAVVVRVDGVMGAVVGSAEVLEIWSGIQRMMYASFRFLNCLKFTNDIERWLC